MSNVNLITSAMNQGLPDEDACAIIKVFRSGCTRVRLRRSRAPIRPGVVFLEEAKG